MFILKIYDRKGVELHLGNIVKISDGSRFTFFCEITYLEQEKVLAPFHTFSFHSFEKVDKVPETATKSTEERYNIWYHYWEEAEMDPNPEAFNKYLMDWRVCESMLEKRLYRIEMIK